MYISQVLKDDAWDKGMIFNALSVNKKPFKFYNHVFMFTFHAEILKVINSL